MGGEAGKILDGPEVGEEVEFFAESYVDALEAAADGRRYRALQRHTVALDRLIERNGNVFAMNLEGLGAGGEALPIEFDAGGFENADGHVRNFGADAITGNQSDLVRLCLRHCFLIRYSSQRFVLESAVGLSVKFNSGTNKLEAISFLCRRGCRAGPPTLP